MRFCALRLIASAGIILLPFAAQAHDPPDVILNAAQFPDGNSPIMDGDPSDWAPIPDGYAVFGPQLYPVGSSSGEGRHSEFFSQGDIDASDMQIKFLAGWNESSNNFFWYSEVFDDIHITRRQDASKFFWDDSVEYQFNYNHEAAEDQNQGDMVTSVDYNYAMPPVDGAWEFYRPLRNLPWLVSGSKWIEVGWGFDGEEFGTSTYYYEFKITPIASMPLSEDALESQVVEGDLEEGMIVHWGSMVNDVDETDGSYENRETQWSMAASGGNASDVTDVLLAPMDPSIEWGEPSTSVEARSWGRIKSQF